MPDKTASCALFPDDVFKRARELGWQGGKPDSNTLMEIRDRLRDMDGYYMGLDTADVEEVIRNGEDVLG